MTIVACPKDNTTVMNETLNSIVQLRQPAVSANVLVGLTKLRLRRYSAEQSMRRMAELGDPNDPQTLRHKHDLGILLARRGKREDIREAMIIFADVLSVQEEVLGVSHAATQRTAANLTRLDGTSSRSDGTFSSDNGRPSPSHSIRSDGTFGNRDSFESASTAKFSEWSQSHNRDSFESPHSSQLLHSSFESGGNDRTSDGLDRSFNSQPNEGFGCIHEEGVCSFDQEISESPLGSAKSAKGPRACSCPEQASMIAQHHGNDVVAGRQVNAKARRLAARPSPPDGPRPCNGRRMPRGSKSAMMQKSDKDMELSNNLARSGSSSSALAKGKPYPELPSTISTQTLLPFAPCVVSSQPMLSRVTRPPPLLKISPPVHIAARVTPLFQDGD